MEKPLHTFYVDFLGPMPPTDKKYRYVFMIVDSCTQFSWLYSTPHKSAMDACTILEKHYNNFGHPRWIITFRHYELDSIEFRNYCIRNGIEYIREENEDRQGYGSERLRIEWASSLLSALVMKEKIRWYTKLRSIQSVMNRRADKDVIRNIKMKNIKEKKG